MQVLARQTFGLTSAVLHDKIRICFPNKVFLHPYEVWVQFALGHLIPAVSTGLDRRDIFLTSCNSFASLCRKRLAVKERGILAIFIANWSFVPLSTTSRTIENPPWLRQHFQSCKTAIMVPCPSPFPRPFRAHISARSAGGEPSDG